MATLNLGRLKPVFRSTWNSATAYNVDDIVVRNNQSYISIQAGTNQDPATATAYWTLMAAKGSDGTDVGATLANKEIAFKTNAGAVDGIPIGNAGEFLKVNSGATGYEFGAVSSDYVKVAESELSSDAHSLIIDNCLTSDYDIYDIEIIKMKSDYNGTDGQLRMRMRDGGASGSDASMNYSTLYDYSYGNFNSTSQARSGAKQYTGGGFYPFNTWNQPDNSFNQGSFRMHHVAGEVVMLTGLSMGRQGNTGVSHWTQYVSMMGDTAITKGSNHTGIRLSTHSSSYVLKAGTKLVIYGIKT